MGIVQEQKFKERILSNGNILDFDAAIHQIWSHPNFAFEDGESSETTKSVDQKPQRMLWNRLCARTKPIRRNYAEA